jgi:oligoendopeptidase F
MRHWSIALLAGAAILAFAPAPSARAADPNDPAFMWDLRDLYPTPDAWDREATALEQATPLLGKYEGALGADPQTLFTALDAMSTLDRRVSRLYTYASLALDADTRVAKNQERRARALTITTKLGAAIAFVNPEILKIGAAKIKAFRAQNPELERRFGFRLDDILRSAPHTLGDEAEKTLAVFGDVFQQPTNVYGIFANGELPYPEVTLSSGEKARLDQPAFDKYRQAISRADRKLVFDQFWGSWKKYEGTIGANLGAAVLTNVANAKTRHFDSALSAALFADNMPASVYRTLVQETNAALPTLHRYLKLRAKLLGVADLAYYDIYPPLFRIDQKYDVPKAEELTLAALDKLGPDYLGELKTGWAGRWMNVYPHQGKASGGYMNGSAYDVHPYLLLNHNDDYQSLSTFAHEWGHAVHTRLTTKAQPYEKSNYSTFTAETASIMNEMLLVDYMIAHAKSKQEKLAYLGEALEAVRGTFFRQVMFAEFQLKLHEEVEAGRPLSGARITDIYCDLLKRYHGEAQGVMKIDPAYCIEWAFVPHFYYGFYVYQYATSMSGAALLAKRIEAGGPRERDVFLAMLRKGGSEYPYQIYKEAGIDMATPAPYRALVARMNAIMDQIEKLQTQK